MRFLLIKKLNENAIIPFRGSPNAAGLDLSSSEELVIPPRSHKLVKTGLSMSIPSGYYGRIAPRSGLAYKHGIDVFAGVIDSDYRGEVGVILYNSSENEFKVNIGDRIAQIIIEYYLKDLGIGEVDSLEETERGDGGYGSTGK